MAIGKKGRVHVEDIVFLIRKDPKKYARVKVKLVLCLLLMDLSPIRQNFEKNRNRQKFHHSLKEHPMFTKIAKFGCQML